MPCLLTVVGGRIELPLNRSFSLGRDSACDIPVADATCSRRHAQLSVGAIEEIVYVIDLGSRNGTLVNDERIQGRATLKHGDRLQIGATVFLVSTSELAVSMDTGTIAHEHLQGEVNEQLLRVMQVHGRADSDIAGQLGTFGIIEVLQFLTQLAHSGTLHVALADGKARVEVRRGEVCAASYRDLDGFEALLELARMEHGVFWLRESYGPFPKTIPQSSAQLLFELCCALDESNRV